MGAQKITSKRTATNNNKEPITIRIPHNLAERLRNTVYWTPGLTLAGIVEKSLERAVGSLERKNGKPFPPRQGNVKTGRPLS
ncbi:MAG: hypothetical protein AAF320_03935 [Myxococcota bacterium]